MFERGNRLAKACRGKVRAVSKRRATEHSSREQQQAKLKERNTINIPSLKKSLRNLTPNTFGRQSRRRRQSCSGDSYGTLISTGSSPTLVEQRLDTQDDLRRYLEETAARTESSPTPPEPLETQRTETDTKTRPREPIPNPNNQLSVDINRIPARYQVSIRQLKMDANNSTNMEKDNKIVAARDEFRGRGLPRNLSRYHLSSAAYRGNKSNIPLPHSTSASFMSSSVASRQDSVSSGSRANFPPRRSSIVQPYEHAVVEETPRASLDSNRGFSRGTVNNPTTTVQGVAVTPQRQLMQPLGPPFPKSQTLTGPALCPASVNKPEKKEYSKTNSRKVEDNKMEKSFDMCEVEAEETVKVLKATCPLKSEIEKERKWKMTALERISNKVGAEKPAELPAEGPPEGGWLWDEDDARLIKTAQPQQYWLGRFNTLLNSFHHEDSFDEPDSATGKNKTSGLGRPTSLSSSQLEEHRVKRAMVALESMCVTLEACESFKEFRTAYCRKFGDQWMKWLVVGREEEEGSMLGEMSRVFLKRGERRTPEPRSERKTSGGHGGRFNNLLRSVRRSLA